MKIRMEYESGIALASSRTPSPPDRIDNDIERDNSRAENELHLPGETCRIDCRGDVVLDESAFVSRFAAPAAKAHFQWRKRADESHELDDCAVNRDGDVDPGEARPPPHKESAEDHEEDEREVSDENDIGQSAVPHQR